MSCDTKSAVLPYSLEYRDRGFSVIPLRGKRPRVAWKKYTERLPTVGELVHWFGEMSQREACPNVGIVCGQISRLVVLDADSEDVAVEIASALPSTQLMSRTGRGMHFFFQLGEGQVVPTRVRIAGIQLDVRGDGSYVVAPPSVHADTGTQYRWFTPIEYVDLDDLPVFDPSWIDNQIGHSQKPARITVKDGPAYIAHIRAICGQGGHNATFRAACKLRDSGLSEAEALVALIEWNRSNAQPPWTVRELLHKVKDAFRHIRY